MNNGRPQHRLKFIRTSSVAMSTERQWILIKPKRVKTKAGHFMTTVMSADHPLNCCPAQVRVDGQRWWSGATINGVYYESRFRMEPR